MIVGRTQDVAIKRADDAVGTKRLAHEFAALERCCDVPGVSKLVSFDSARGELAVRWVHGVALGPAAWRASSSTERRAVALALIDTLRAVHGRGVVHRDLKPANVILSPGGRVTLIDFDHALIDGDGPSGGTRPYAAPELFYLPSPRLIDYRADYFALALLLRGLLFDLPYQLDEAARWQLVASRAPWPKRDDPLLSAIERHLVPWREDRPPTLDAVQALVAEVGESPSHRGGAGGPRVAAPVSEVWQALASDLPEGLCTPVSLDLESLSPHLAPDAPLHPLRLASAELKSLVTRLARRQALIAAGRPADAFAVAHIGLSCGLLRETLMWSRERGDPEAALIEAIAANSFGAHRDAEHRLVASPHSPGTSVHDATIHAVAAESLARRGRATEARERVRMASLFPRASTVEERSRFWSAVTSTYLAQMDIAGLVSLLETVPREELRAASLVVLDVGDEHARHALAHNARCRSRHPDHRGLFDLVALRGLTELHHMLVELALIHWPGTRADTPHILDVVETASDVLSVLEPDDPFGPLVRTAALAQLGRVGEAWVLARAMRTTFAPLAAILVDLAPPGAAHNPAWYGLVAGWALGLEPLKRHVASQFETTSLAQLRSELDALFEAASRCRPEPTGATIAERNAGDQQRLDALIAGLECELEGLSDDDARPFLSMLEDLFEALRLHGQSHSAVRLWRIRFLAVQRDYQGVVACVAEAHQHGDRDWRMWLLAVPAYLSLGRRIGARMALSLLHELAPDDAATQSVLADFERHLAG